MKTGIKDYLTFDRFGQKTILSNRVIQGALLVFFVSFAHTIEAQDIKPKDLIKKVVEANGGLDNYKKIKDVSYDYWVHNEGKNERENSQEKYIINGEISCGVYSAHESFIFPKTEGSVVVYNDANGTLVSVNGKEITDEKEKFPSYFFRRANFHWFNMMFKLLDNGINYEALPDRSVNGIDYRVLEMTYTKNTGEYQDKFILYINPQTNLIDQFLFNVQAFNIQEPFLMKVQYQDIEGIKVMNYRELTASNWNGDVLNDVWTKEVSTNIEFNTGFTMAELKAAR